MQGALESLQFRNDVIIQKQLPSSDGDFDLRCPRKNRSYFNDDARKDCDDPCPRAADWHVGSIGINESTSRNPVRAAPATPSGYAECDDLNSRSRLTTPS